MDIRTAVRIEFSRDSRAKYLSHLDLMRVFERAVRRSGIPVHYSYGFNPHADMVFGLPLQLGVTADAECLDIGLEYDTSEDITAEYIAEALRLQLPPGLTVRRAATKETKDNAMAQITHATYVMGIANTEPGSLARAVELFLLPGRRVVQKVTKKTTREVDIAPLVKKIEAFGTSLIMTVRAGSADNVKPDMVLDALREVCLPERASSDGGADFCRASLHRTGIFIERGGELLSPLDYRVLR